MQDSHQKLFACVMVMPFGYTGLALHITSPFTLCLNDFCTSKWETIPHKAKNKGLSAIGLTTVSPSVFLLLDGLCSPVVDPSPCFPLPHIHTSVPRTNCSPKPGSDRSTKANTPSSRSSLYWLKQTLRFTSGEQGKTQQWGSLSRLIHLFCKHRTNCKVNTWTLEMRATEPPLSPQTESQ